VGVGDTVGLIEVMKSLTPVVAEQAGVQPWIFSDGSSLLRSSRLNNLFRKVDGIWKVARTRTENVFVAPLKAGWAHNVPDRSVLRR